MGSKTLPSLSLTTAGCATFQSLLQIWQIHGAPAVHHIDVAMAHLLIYNCRHQSGVDEVNPYLSPLLEDPILPSPTPVADMGSGVLHTCTDSLKRHDKKEAVAELLCDMSMSDAVQCITQFLRCDKR